MTIRAELVRHALLGGCEAMPVGPVGPYLRGAWIKGQLDLKLIDTRHALQLEMCRLEQEPLLWDAKMFGLSLSGSHVPGLSAHRLRTEGPVLLCDIFKSYGQVDMEGASIGGTLDCDDGKFDGLGEDSLHFDGMRVGSDLLMGDSFHAVGLVNLRGACVGGHLNCSGGRFDGAGRDALNGDSLHVGADVFLRDGFRANGLINLVGAEIGAQLDCTNGCFDGGEGEALNFNSMHVGNSVYMRDGFHSIGHLNLVGARIEGVLEVANAQLEGEFDLEAARLGEGLSLYNLRSELPFLDLTDVSCGVLRDEAAAWGAVKIKRLSGFSYDRIQSDMGIADRLHWLSDKHERGLPPEMAQNLRAQPWLGPNGHGFDPQPYTQLAKVLDAQGNRGGAARVLEVREHRLRGAAQKRAFGRIDGTWRAAFGSLPALAMQGWDWVFRGVFGYGHAPARALLWVAGIWAIGFFLYGAAYSAGQMAPNSDVILTSGDWVRGVSAYLECSAAGVDCVKPLHAWLTTESARDYETFSAGLYALDLFVPLDALGQEITWAPSTSWGVLGQVAYWARMPIQLAGWIITAVGAAVLTGLVGRKE